MSLEAILEYEMPEQQAKAYKLCLCWEKICEIELKGYRYARLPKKGDPRKCLLFQYCFKLARETQGLIPDTEYKLYILAQIRTLKAYSEGNVHSLIAPSCLCGPPAWKRWKIWKYKFDKEYKKVALAGTTDDIKAGKSHIIADLERTKDFLEKNKIKSGRDLEKAITEKEFFKWVAFSKISPYFVIFYQISKKRWENLEDSFSFDPALYEKELDADTNRWFKANFNTFLEH